MGSGLYSCLGLRGWSWVRSGRYVRLGYQGSTAVVGMAYEVNALGTSERVGRAVRLLGGLEHWGVPERVGLACMSLLSPAYPPALGSVAVD